VIDVIGGAPLQDIDITGLTCDSRKVAPGFLFAALPGAVQDGRRFIADALAQGAAAVLASRGSFVEDAFGDTAALLTCDNPRRRYALMAARFHGRQPKTVAAVTGTNGKTSVASFARQIWTGLGHSAASLGTLGLEAPGRRVAGSLTTPDPGDLHALLAELAAAGVDWLAMEASSHGLSQYRLDGVRVSSAAFTNLSRDHLDYHGSMGDYLSAKTRLFTDILDVSGSAVLNADDATFGALRIVARDRGCKVLSYGTEDTDIRLVSLAPDAAGQVLSLDVMGTSHRLRLPLAGAFQAMNAMAALGLVIAGGDAPQAAVAELETLQGVPGRLQLIGENTAGGAVYVDYAHTPDALAHALDALRQHTRGRLAVVFGCGGDRDRGKRPEMGRIAGERADRVIVTDDNPRSEDAAAIRSEILQACTTAMEIGDRAEAIAKAIHGLGAGDVLVVAGKGHESGQIVGTDVLPFDDGEVVRAVIAGGAS